MLHNDRTYDRNVEVVPVEQVRALARCDYLYVCARLGERIEEYPRSRWVKRDLRFLNADETHAAVEDGRLEQRESSPAARIVPSDMDLGPNSTSSPLSPMPARSATVTYPPTRYGTTAAASCTTARR